MTRLSASEARRTVGLMRRFIRREPGSRPPVRLIRPPIGFARWGSLRRPVPISRTYGFDRGLPIDRYYIEDFLARHGAVGGYAAGDIRGAVLEVGGEEYTRRFGAADRIDVLHASEANPGATIVADLTDAEGLPTEAFDCVIATQTLHLIYDVRAAIASVHQLLKPGGIFLATFPGISPASLPERDHWGDFWRFTGKSARLLFEEVFPAEGVEVEAYGNVTAAVAFLHGLSARELHRAELDVRDPQFEVLIAVRAVRAAGSASS